ncbi:ATP-binding protein [Myxococcota bacterium]|nr:ATP-binding protein [Myxococcota bacterium]
MSELRAFRVTNLRSIKDSGWVQLKPLTLLVGANSSGKSTLLRLFPLLKQSVLQPTQGPMLWYDENFVDFGGFNEAVNSRVKEKVIELGFEMRLQGGAERRGLIGRPNKGVSEVAQRPDDSLKVTIHLAPESKADDRTRLKLIQVQSRSGDVELQLEDGHFTRIKVGEDEQSFPDQLRPWLAADGRLIPSSMRANTPARTFLRSPFHESVIDALRALAHKNTGPDTLLFAAMELSMDSIDGLKAQLKDSSLNSLNGKEHDEGSLRRLSDALIRRDIWGVLGEADAQLSSHARQIAYLRPFRDDPRRSYRHQDLKIDSINPTGANLAMFLRSLSASDKKGFDEWTQAKFGFKVSARSRDGSTSLRIERDGEEHNLIDMGYGFSQVLPVIAQLWMPTRSLERTKGRRAAPISTICVEQPELHLHPGMQRQLARAIGSVVARGRELGEQASRTPLMVETHSQSILLEIGKMVGAKELHPDDVQVLFFERRRGEDTVVKTFAYDEEGVLPEAWPFGFLES